VTEESESLPQLPIGWVWTKIQHISETASGGTPSRSKKEYFGGRIPWLKSGELNNQIIDSSEESITQRGFENSSARIVHKGTLLIALYGATVGKLGILGIDTAINQAICAISPYEGISIKFLFWYLSQHRNELLNIRKGGAQPNISQDVVKHIPIPLAPFPEQCRIISRVEELFSFLDAGVESLQKVKKLLKRYRQAVLKYAFEGKLTEEWRKTHKDQTEPAQKLLEHIKQQRKKKADYRELQSVDGTELPKLPEEWLWTSIGQIYDIVGGGTPSTSVDKYWTGSIPWITSADIYGLKDIRPRKNITKCGIENSATNMVPEGSLIVATRVGLGKIALTKMSLCFSQDCQALVGDRSSIFPEYSVYYLSKAVQVFKYRHRGTTIGGVPKKQLSELPFPLPSFDEQTKIVEEIEHHFSITDEVEKAVEQDLEQADRLRQSILKTAFEGKLVPQDPSDEHADSLLARIKEQKAKHENRVSNIVDQKRKGLMHYVE
jgi:type I restriction enzyme S subunit